MPMETPLNADRVSALDEQVRALLRMGERLEQAVLAHESLSQRVALQAQQAGGLTAEDFRACSASAARLVTLAEAHRIVRTRPAVWRQAVARVVAAVVAPAGSGSVQ